MKKTISINIGGFVFNIEEDAYDVLASYLENIKNNFSNSSERDEIMQDIEARIAEIFQSQLLKGRQVVTMSDVESVMEIMGQPEDYISSESEEKAESKNNKNQNSETRSGEKRLYRDTENATLGGVCSGLSHYTGLDVSIVRILFVLFTILGGSGILIYIVLLLVIPAAKTTSDKLQMTGQNINVDTIKEHFTTIKNNLKDQSKSGKLRKTINETFDKGIQAGSTFITTFSKILGILFILGGTFALIFIFVVLFGETGFLPLGQTADAPGLLEMLNLLYPGDIQSKLVFISILIVTILPVVAMIITGTKVLFGIKKKLKTLSIASALVWFTGVATLIVTGISLGLSMRANGEITKVYTVVDSTENHLYIDVAPDTVFSDHIVLDEVWNQSELIKVNEEKIFIGYSRLYLSSKKDSGDYEIIVRKYSQGISTKDAIAKSENILYNIQLNNLELNLPSYFAIPVADKIRGQNIEVEVLIPSGRGVKLSESIDRIEIETESERYYPGSYAATTWISANGDLICTSCTEIKKGDDDDDHD